MDYYNYYFEMFDRSTDHRVYASYKETLWENRDDPDEVREEKFKALNELIDTFRIKRKFVK